MKKETRVGQPTNEELRRFKERMNEELARRGVTERVSDEDIIGKLTPGQEFIITSCMPRSIYLRDTRTDDSCILRERLKQMLLEPSSPIHGHMTTLGFFTGLKVTGQLLLNVLNMCHHDFNIMSNIVRDKETNEFSFDDIIDFANKDHLTENKIYIKYFKQRPQYELN